MPAKLGKHDGERADLPGLGTRHLISGEQSDGRFALVEHTIPPRTLAAPTHVHEREDEYSFVLSGRVGARIGDQEVEAVAGELIAKPRGVPHAFWNPGSEEARLLELIAPAGFERYFAELAPLVAGSGAPDMDAIAEIQARYGIAVDVSTIGPLIERHRLER